MDNKPLRDKTYIQQGFNARKQGKALYDCPYQIYTKPSDLWLDGWFKYAKIVLDKKYPNMKH